ncbi:hypothetical protein VNO80_21405 [Phaseolus coccineus]|uniref:Uncharacterized protein n=1 Tax=Phaseolus coccineus TaxID=3886 RepID=A0AAN9QU18_PHACN
MVRMPDLYILCWGPSYVIEEEPLWTMYYNGKKNGYKVQREVTEEDLYVMELLKAVSMGVDILSSRSKVEEGGDSDERGELL